MATSGQILSRNGQARLQPFEQAPRPMVGYANDYLSGHETGLHRHPRAQLLFAIAGVMRIMTEAACSPYRPGPGCGCRPIRCMACVWTARCSMRALFLRADAAASGPSVTTCDRSLAAVAGIDPDSV